MPSTPPAAPVGDDPLPPALALPGLEVRPVAAADAATVAAAATRGFEGYVVPLAFTPAAYERRFRAEHLDPWASRYLRWQGGPAGALLVARRGWTARVAALGVAPELRGRGVGAALLRLAAGEARARGERALLLEVIEQNPRALALYEREGFVRRRRLVGYRRPPPAHGLTAHGLTAGGADALGEVDPAEAAEEARAEGPAALPWALAPATLAGLGAPAMGYHLAGAAYALVGDVGADPVPVLALVVRRAARGRGWGRRLVEALAARVAPRALQLPPNVPEGLAAGFFARTGWAPLAITQFEMGLALGGPAPG